MIYLATSCQLLIQVKKFFERMAVSEAFNKSNGFTLKKFELVKFKQLLNGSLYSEIVVLEMPSMGRNVIEVTGVWSSGPVRLHTADTYPFLMVLIASSPKEGSLLTFSHLILTTAILRVSITIPLVTCSGHTTGRGSLILY